MAIASSASLGHPQPNEFKNLPDLSGHKHQSVPYPRRIILAGMLTFRDRRSGLRLLTANRPRAATVALIIALIAVATAILVLTAISTPGSQHPPVWRVQPPLATSVAPAPSPEPTTPVPVPAPADLPVFDYGPAPGGFPADPDPYSTAQLTAAVHPETRIAVYDALGGQPKAFLDPTIRGVPITMPIIEQELGWVAIMLPSTNRTMGWLAPGGWTQVPLRDQLVVRRGTHEMSWLREGALRQTWPVTLGVSKTPTPLGRTFVLGRSRLQGAVYAGLDVLALGAVPDNVEALPRGLQGAHIGIHTWYNDYTLGKDDSDGCIRLTKSGHQLLLSEIIPGTPVVVID